MRQPGPIKAFYERVRARRGYHVAIVAAARKLACLFWCLLSREEDYAFQQPSLTRKKLRRLEITAGAQRYTTDGQRHLGRQRRGPTGRAGACPPSRARLRPHRARLARHPGQQGGRERDKGARIQHALKGQSCAADHKPLTSALRYVIGTRPPDSLTPPSARRAQAGSSASTHPRARQPAQRASRSPPRSPPSATAERSNALRQAPATCNHRKIRPKPAADPLDFHPSRRGAAPAAVRRAC